MKSYWISEREVLEEQKRLVSRHYNLKEMEKFSSIDKDNDGNRRYKYRGKISKNTFEISMSTVENDRVKKHANQRLK
jgi:DNA-directed RNA polymerase beta subunit